MHYGNYNENKKKSNGQKVHPLEAKISEGEHKKYMGPTDHPRTSQHILPLLLAWQANCNSQPIIDNNFNGLHKYMAGYACKDSKATTDWVNIFKSLVKSSPNANSSIKKSYNEIDDENCWYD